MKWLTLGLCISLAGYSTNISAVQLSWEIQENLPKQVQVKADLYSPPPFYGMPDLRRRNEQSRSMVYWGSAGIEVFFAQILFHAVVANEIKNKKQNAEQEQANQVLTPYSDLIKQGTHKRLVDFTLRNYPGDELEFSIHGDEIPDGEFIVAETTPAFFISQDEKSIILRHLLKASLASAPDQVIFENSAQINSSNPFRGVDGRFGKNDKDFNAITQRLYSITFRALIKDLYGRLNNPAKEKTYKYYIGDERFYERASLIEETCEAQTLRNLRGHILILEKQQVECNQQTGLKTGE